MSYGEQFPLSGQYSLCGHCHQIPFDDVDLLRKSQGTVFSLGTGERLYSSANSCPFCYLVWKSLYEDKRGRESSHSAILQIHEEISIEWQPENGVFAFRPNASRHRIVFGVPDKDDGLAPTSMSEHRVLKPKTGSRLSIPQISLWLSRCEEHHVDGCLLRHPDLFESAFPGLETLRLIDVRSLCVKEVTEVPQYVALSYVWGSVSSLRLTKANRSQLLLPGSLHRIWTLIPTTIQDAIFLVSRLGVRYLWVDSVCLLQNDPEDLRQGIEVMDLVYERAWLTIIASHGHDANAGLPGTRWGSRKPSKNTIQVKPGVWMGLVVDGDVTVESTVYGSRAWTFQEQVLSRRVLCFTDTKVFFRCRQEMFDESCVENEKVSPWPQVASPLGYLPPSAIEMNWPVYDFGIMVLYYSMRVLTHQSDALRALAGITRRFADRMGFGSLQGLPTGVFDYFLLFHGTLLRRRSSFPSYSWAGWIGRADNILLLKENTELNDWLRERTWIRWYMRDASGATSPVWDPEANRSFPPSDPSFTGYRTRRPFCLDTSSEEILGLRNTACTLPTADIEFARTNPPYPMLQFWTVTAFYKLGKVDVFSGAGFVVGSNGSECGMVTFDGYENSCFFDQPGSFEFAVLSESEQPQHSDPNPMGPLEKTAGRDYPLERDTGWRYYNVLILECIDGVAERRGIGRIFQQALKDSFGPGPVWKEIIMT